MKKAQNKILNFCKLNFLFMCFFCFNNVSCGLDTYIVMEEPLDGIGPVNNIQYSNIDKTSNYFEFVTHESDYTEDDILGKSEFKFLGTEVYYKIYSNTTTLDNEVNTLVSLSSSSTSKANASTKLVNPTSSGGYGYVPLKATNYYGSPLIKATGKNQRVYIRLTDYQSIYDSKITVDGHYLNGSASKTVPARNVSDESTFNFGRDGTKDLVPLSGDTDVKYTTVTEAGKWYVAMFAVGVGRDTTFSTYYSNIAFLGSVTIDENSYDN